MRLKDKTAVIIGASKGIGRGIAELFAKEGAKLVLVGRNEAALEALAKECGPAIACRGDISSAADMEAVAKKAEEAFGRIDILVQNAGVYPQVPIDKMTEDQWDHVLDTNLKGTFLAVKAVLPLMKKQKYGRIVLTSSISGPKVGWPGGAHYTASKAGMNGLMRTAAVELARHNITINGVEPGNILTEGLEETGEEWMRGMERAIPMGRLGTAEEVAYAHLFLASDEARYITGQTIVVDGGQILPESPFL